MTTFEEILINNLDSCKSNEYLNNYDHRRFGEKKKSRRTVISTAKNILKRILLSVGIYPVQSKTDISDEKKIFNNLEKLSSLYMKLGDVESKNILVQVLSYRILGGGCVKLPLNTSEYWKKLEELDLLAKSGEEVELDFLGWKLNKICLESEGYPVELFVRPSGVYNQFILQQYRCQIDGSAIEVKFGDVVIDAGACYGDTAINFACIVGEAGRVYSWEFMPENLEIFKRNLDLNPSHARHIELVENPVWSSSGEKLYVTGLGPAARVSSMPPIEIESAVVVETYTIDDLQRDKMIDFVNFIKMDIEGAELHALKGAKDTICKFKPKLAISIYHNLEDFWEIPEWIDGLGLGYRFFIRHFTIHVEETVLFAVVNN